MNLEDCPHCDGIGCNSCMKKPIPPPPATVEREETKSSGSQILRYILAEGEPSEGSGWLIEKGQMAFGVVNEHACWVAYTHPGVLRFARERDAVGMLWGMRSFGDNGFEGCYVSEHLWGFPPTAQPSEIDLSNKYVELAETLYRSDDNRWNRAIVAYRNAIRSLQQKKG